MTNNFIFKNIIHDMVNLRRHWFLLLLLLARTTYVATINGQLKHDHLISQFAESSWQCFTKQEAHGPNAHLRNQFQSINTFAQSYNYIITLILRGRNDHLLFDNWIVLICKTLSPLHQRMLCAKVGWNWPSWFWRFLNFVNLYFRHFEIISTWKRPWQSFEQTCIRFTKGCFVPIWFKLTLCFLRSRF